MSRSDLCINERSLPNNHVYQICILYYQYLRRYSQKLNFSHEPTAGDNKYMPEAVFYVPSLKGPPGASMNRIIRLFPCPPVCP